MIKDIDVLSNVIFVICMIYRSMRDIKVVEIAGEVVEIAFQEERFCKKRAWRCAQVFGDRSNKIGVEKY